MMNHESILYIFDCIENKIDDHQWDNNLVLNQIVFYNSEEEKCRVGGCVNYEYVLHIDNNRHDNFDRTLRYERFLLRSMLVRLVDDKHSIVGQISDENNQYNVFAWLHRQ